jgi:hypothetical protein
LHPSVQKYLGGWKIEFGGFQEEGLASVIQFAVETFIF